jgi:hypothetical protein
MTKAASTKKSSDGKRKAVETASTDFIKASELHEAKKVKKNSPDEEVAKKVCLYLSHLSIYHEGYMLISERPDSRSYRLRRATHSSRYMMKPKC